MPSPSPANEVSAAQPAGSRLLLPMVLGAGYFVFAGLIYGFDALAGRFSYPNLQYAGLALDVVLLGGLFAWLNRRASRLATALGPILALLVVVLLFAVADVWVNGELARFWSLENLRTVCVQTATIAVAALGMTMIIICGGIDLSAGTAIALAATVLAWMLDAGYPVGAALAAALGTGLVTGVLNGALVSLLGVVPFIITLGTMTAYLGLAKLIAKETTVRPPLDSVPGWLSGLVKPTPSPEWLAWPLAPNLANAAWLTVLLACGLAAVLHLTVFGRHVFAVGSNEATARLCGVSIVRTKVLVYTLAGLFIGTAGVFQFARLSSGNPTSGIGLELKVIAAVVIGGGSLRGGRGSVLGTLTGALVMQVIASGSNALRLSNPIQDVIVGVIIIAAVTLDQIRQRRLGSSWS